MSGRKGKSRGKIVPGLDVSRYARPPKRPMSSKNRAIRWQTFRIVKTAIKTLKYFGLHVSPRSITDTTALLALGMPGYRRIPEKTMLGNDLCVCIYDVWKTTKSAVRSVAKPTIHIPRSVKGKSAAELRVMYVTMKQRFEEAERGRLALIGQVRKPSSEADIYNRRIAMLAAAAEAAAEAEASCPGVAGEGTDAVQGQAYGVGDGGGVPQIQ